MEALLELLKAGGFQPLRQTQLLEQAGLDEQTALPLLKQAAFHKQLVRVAEDLWYLPLQLERFPAPLRHHGRRRGLKASLGSGGVPEPKA